MGVFIKSRLKCKACGHNRISTDVVNIYKYTLNDKEKKRKFTNFLKIEEDETEMELLPPYKCTGCSAKGEVEKVQSHIINTSKWFVLDVIWVQFSIVTFSYAKKKFSDSFI